MVILMDNIADKIHFKLVLVSLNLSNNILFVK